MAVGTLTGLVKRIGNVNPDRFEYSFSQRLVLQKTIYLMQNAFGLDLGYSFSWYVHGPYSPDLTREAYSMIRVFRESPTVEFVNRNLEARFERFLKFIEPHKSDETWLTIAASIVYMSKQGKPVKTICQIIESKDRCFTREKCLEVWMELDLNGILPPST